MLEDLVSREAAALYRWLVLNSPGVAHHTSPGAALNSLAAPAALGELLQLGLVLPGRWPDDEPVPVSPLDAFAALLTESHRYIQARCDEIAPVLKALERRRVSRCAGIDQMVDLLTEPDDISRAAKGLREEAEEEHLILLARGPADVAPAGWPDPAAMDVPTRMLHPDGWSVPHGVTARRLTGAPVHALVSDGQVALIALADAPGSALLIRSGPLTHLISRWFELLWHDAEPSEPENPLTPYQRRILSLLLQGRRDAQVAQLTGTSTRTVRRHIAAIMELLQAPTRFAAGVEAHRRGWVARPDAAYTGRRSA